MKRLILLRHAKTEPWYEGIDDEGRALLPRGREDAGRIAGALLGLGWSPDLVLLSPSRRTRETWLCMADRFPAAGREIVEALYLAGVRGLASAVSGKAGAAGLQGATLMVIGHNPGLHDFACAILRDAGTLSEPAAASLSVRMPTGAAALFESAADAGFEARDFRLAGFLTPKSLG